ncbi:MAG: hypothetical protein KAI86_06080, partial [Desulfobacterales bacterium]|nr:hypothetical protein [Desulfobacterales bacterium]
RTTSTPRRKLLLRLAERFNFIKIDVKSRRLAGLIEKISHLWMETNFYFFMKNMVLKPVLHFLNLEFIVKFI